MQTTPQICGRIGAYQSSGAGGTGKQVPDSISIWILQTKSLLNWDLGQDIPDADTIELQIWTL